MSQLKVETTEEKIRFHCWWKEFSEDIYEDIVDISKLYSFEFSKSFTEIRLEDVVWTKSGVSVRDLTDEQIDEIGLSVQRQIGSKALIGKHTPKEWHTILSIERRWRDRNPEL